MIATTPVYSLASQVAKKFKEIFSVDDALVVRSPGRVNLIGEHTDYNNGFVLPAAIDKAIFMAIDRRSDEEVHLFAMDYDQSYRGPVKPLTPSALHWPNYILGVVEQLQQMGHSVGGFNCVFAGDLPLGAGLSSSAALESATAFALNQLFGLGLDTMTMVRIAQKAENEFVGLQCGIMDMFASMFGRKDQVIRLDCQSLDYTYFPFQTNGLRILLLDTKVEHSLASSEYNIRRQQCEAGVKLVQKHHPHVKSLRDVTAGMLADIVGPADELIYKRCSFVVEENARVLAGTEDLQRGDVAAFGQKMYASHEGLSRKYEVSCPESDWLVEQVSREEGVLGARQMGGGFGGCTINLVKADVIDGLTAKIAPLYRKAMNRELKWYIGQIENGTSVV
ncbi:galactokinase [Puia dinghuensis]|uniref:Galactokinase n=1 Tax=Puia dinghuensis TaxID=1792502 RepID=A0A8J2U7F1_9BACT|nr:galactokinase [Puia dinghuensis]GGA83947.1 galactokinase [Puia dinghuensis]